MTRIKRLFIYPIWLGLMLLIAFLLGGCVSLIDPESSQENSTDLVAVIKPQQIIGQTFISRRGGLNGIFLWLRVVEPIPAEAHLTVELLHLLPETNSYVPVTSVAIPFTEIQKHFPMRIAFPIQDYAPEQQYYLRLRTHTGSIEVLGREGNTDGELRINDKPKSGDIAFRLTYDFGWRAILNDLVDNLKNLWLIFPILIVLWLPGNLILNVYELIVNKHQEKSFDWGERLALSTGMSAAVIPVTMLWCTVLGLRWNTTALLITAVLCLIILILIFFYKRNKQKKKWITTPIRPDWISILLMAVFIYALFLRLVMVRDLSAPAWVDSIHHAVITRLITENGGFPFSYQPYIDTNTASYHPGFHSLLATFQWLSGKSILEAMLLFGQVLNALSVFASYLFTKSITGSRSTGLAAAMLTGIFTPMPTYYTSWGRYTQLCGLLILPTAIKLLKDLIRLKKPNPLLIGITGIAWAGLFLTHYRVVAFGACLILIIHISRVIQSIVKKDSLRKPIRETIWLGVTSSFALLVSLPWWPPYLKTLIAPTLRPSNPFQTALFSDFSWGYLTSAWGIPSMVLAGLGVIWGMIRRRWFVISLLLWITVLFFLANLSALKLPGGWFINNTSVTISLFIPISTCGGFLLGDGTETIGKLIPARGRTLFNSSLILIFVLLAIMGGRSLLPILNPATFLFRESDKPAMTWMEQNIPPDQTIMINPFLWGYGWYAGSDGGYWITPLTGRKTIPPPAIFAMGNNKQNIVSIKLICAQLIENKSDAATIYQIFQGHNIQFVYLGKRGGVLSAKTLLQSPLFHLVYNHEGTYLFQLRTPP